MTLNLVGQTFGRWKVSHKSGKNKHGNFMWLCVCECGTESEIIGSSLKSGLTTSCGCYRKEAAYNRFLTHGHTTEGKETVEYVTWHSIKDRCNNTNSKNSMNYGVRGIKICERWLSFQNFINDMGPRPSNKHSIERIDVNKDYEPSNCIWVTKQDQERNKRVKNGSKSGATGVTWESKRKKWLVRITKDDGIQINLGRYSDLKEAITVRKNAELTYWGKSS